MPKAMNIYLVPKSTTWLDHSAEQREMGSANIRGQTFVSVVSRRSARQFCQSWLDYHTSLGPWLGKMNQVAPAEQSL